jgi:hypothetical protein
VQTLALVISHHQQHTLRRMAKSSVQTGSYCRE